MQTFLPYRDFEETASVLDRRRLGKQRVETMQIMTALCEGHGWVNHPAVKMWSTYEESLLQYQDAICREWGNRGYRDSCWDKTIDILERSNLPRRNIEPHWLGDPDFHLSHQSNLVRKDPEHYGSLFIDVPDDIPYIWPVS